MYSEIRIFMIVKSPAILFDDLIGKFPEEKS